MKPRRVLEVVRGMTEGVKLAQSESSRGPEAVSVSRVARCAAPTGHAYPARLADCEPRPAARTFPPPPPRECFAISQPHSEHAIFWFHAEEPPTAGWRGSMLLPAPSGSRKASG